MDMNTPIPDAGSGAAPSMPAPAMQPPPAPPPVVASAAPASFAEGGVAGIFSDIKITDIFIVSLVTLAMVYNIYYCRTMIIQARTWKTKEQQQIDELKANMQSMLGPDYKSYS